MNIRWIDLILSLSIGYYTLPGWLGAISCQKFISLSPLQTRYPPSPFSSTNHPCPPSKSRLIPYFPPLQSESHKRRGEPQARHSAVTRARRGRLRRIRIRGPRRRTAAAAAAGRRRPGLGGGDEVADGRRDLGGYVGRDVGSDVADGGRGIADDGGDGRGGAAGGGGDGVAGGVDGGVDGGLAADFGGGGCCVCFVCFTLVSTRVLLYTYFFWKGYILYIYI